MPLFTEVRGKIRILRSSRLQSPASRLQSSRHRVGLNATTPDHRPTSSQTGRGNVASCCDSLPADFQRISGSCELRLNGVLGSSALPWCSFVLCALEHIHSPRIGVCCLLVERFEINSSFERCSRY